MFITQVLCLKKLKWLPKVRPHGHLFRGKDRLVRKVTPNDMKHMKNALDIEERNMFYLRHPFLSADECKYVGRDYVKSFEKMIKAGWERRMERFCKSVQDRKNDTFFHQRVDKANKWE